jgi:outer membrane protein assembly factor BamB
VLLPHVVLFVAQNVTRTSGPLLLHRPLPSPLFLARLFQVHAVDAVTGALLWTGTLDAAVFAAPTVAGGRLIVADWASTGHVYMYGLDAPVA